MPAPTESAATESAEAHTNHGLHGRHTKLPGMAPWCDSESLGLDTVSVHGGLAADDATGAILCPVYMSTAFVQPSVEGYLAKGFSYSRQDNPTVRAFERRVAALEAGLDAICVNSGMAATTTVFSALLKTGDHCILTSSSYGGTNRCARTHFSKYGINFDYVDMRDPRNIEQALRAETRLVFSETPTNPVLHLVDIAEVTAIVRRHNAKQSPGGAKVLHVCDSTFATPLICRPLQLGADVVCISTTKYYDGHNTSVGGAIVVKSDPDLVDRLSLQRNILGNIMTPQVAFMQMQLVKTMPVRVRQQCATALAVAQFLETHPAVQCVAYPGLKFFPQKELADRQHLEGLHGGMLCFEVRGGTAAGVKLMNSVKRPWTLGENLGSCESIITCPAVFTHANMLAEDRRKVGITDGMIRVSCGIEDAADLITALKEALDTLL